MFNKIGPGVLVAAAFVGPGTITMCTLAGTNFGYALLWALLVSVLATIILQGMAGRIGLVTQSGLVDVVRTELKTRWVKNFVIAIVLGAILVGNAAYEAGNIGGATLGLEQLLPQPQLRSFLPTIIGSIIFLLLWFSSYKILEKIFVGLVGVMGASFVICAVLVQPSISEIFKGMFIPRLPENGLLTVVALVGTTVVPYNLFLHASLVKEKWNSKTDLKAVNWDTIVSIGLGGLVSMAILITASAAPISEINNALDMAKALEPLFGKMAFLFMAIGLLAAGITSAITAPLAAAYVASSCFGWEGGMQNKKFKMVWTIVLLCGVLFLSFDIKPIEVIQFAQVANGILLPVMALLLLWVVNKKSVMGENKNSLVQNAFGVAIVLFTIFLGAKSIFKVIGLF
ncbi:Nramp family divalent metal transporter [Muricauda ruestringensis]|uniref:Nramp family divalent metal transporter n=1 Tax=Flagellimonas aurea TaxID=2915619 RepID=A0ABS3G891_9FLAO|nr:Nramp family divalent metal transporter [Allomuricauda aurea]MAO15348.1 manganese transporter [Allomuricauda sp.]MBO0355615.1 Nramp family divalent metal transporter [Allomuricauda aurea]|tara:strand:+ start:299 stop:1495 length:1197 start_codon:yes stop_codon:yes gene_type:complete